MKKILDSFYVTIESRSNFKSPEIPDYYPGTVRYIKFWREEKRKCIEGNWVFDNGGYRWTPPNLYFYINYGTILHNINKGAKVKMRPPLRDIEWEFFYNIIECLGFSGFEDDDEYSCHTSLIGEESIHPSAIDSKGNAKKYMPARQYLRALHEKPLGKAIYENNKKNLFLLGSRGLGKSYLLAVGVFLHAFLFDGATDINQKKNQIALFIGSALSDKVDVLIEKFNGALENLPGSITSGNTYFPSPFYKKTEGTLTGSKGMLIAKYEQKIGGNWVTKGSLSYIRRGTFTIENPNAATGGRWYILGVEEVGLLGNAIAVHGQNEATQREGSDKIGITIYIGTGGDIDKVVESETIFRNPTQYSCLEFDDVWENTGKIGWFVPYEYCLNQFKDENGNTILEKAHQFIEKERILKSKGSGAYKTLSAYVMSYPVKPSEMFLTKENKYFPIYELSERQKELKADNLYLKLAKPARLTWDGDKVKAEIDYTLFPLLEFRRPKDYDSIEGCPVIYEFPLEIGGKTPDYLYVCSLDHYHSDEVNNEGSLAAFYILKTYRYAHKGLGFSEVVAEYIGRPYGGKNAFNENVEKLMAFYGLSPGTLMYENTKGNIYEYFLKKNKLHLLAKKPVVVMSNKLANLTFSSLNFGYEVPNREVKLELISYLYDWLLEDRGDGTRNYQKIPSLGLVTEMLNFTLEGNFDRVMGFIGCILALREFQNEFKERAEQKNINSAASFWSENKNIFRNGKQAKIRQGII